jgi:hypothetical protein
MFSRRTLFVWIGIILLSGLFLMGQDTWHPSGPCFVFVSSTTVDGSISVEGADQRCQAEADEYSLDGDYRAWISDTSSSPDTRFDKGGYPYKLPGGQIVANNWADLTDGTLDNIIIQLPNGTELAWGVHVWTNTFDDGTAANVSSNPSIDSCDNWTNGGSDPTGIYGQTGPLSWSYNSSESCSTPNRLYCFEQK